MANYPNNTGGVQPNAHKPTEENSKIVRELYAAGIPQKRIAERLDIDDITLRKYYKADLDACKDHMIAALGTNLYQDALNGNEKSREFWLKCQGRWSYAKDPEDLERDKKQDTLIEKLIDKL